MIILWPKASWAEKKSNIFLACHSSLLREGRIETQAESVEEGCFLTCCFESCWTTFLTLSFVSWCPTLRGCTTKIRMAILTLKIMNMLHRLACRLFWGRHFLSWGFLSLDDISFYHVDRELAWTVGRKKE